MDSRLCMFGLNFPSRNAAENLAQYHTDNTFLIDAAGCCVDALDPKGIKRKWSDFGESGKESVSLALGLGRPSSSSDSSRKSSATPCTMSSVKETDDDSSIDLGLNFDFNLGKEYTTCLKKPALAVARPKVDLQLSLSIGRSESGITGITTVLTSNYLLDEIRSFAQLSSQDEGSTSSRWRHGNKLMQYLNSTEKSGTVFPERTVCDSIPARFPDFSVSTMMEPQKISDAASDFSVSTMMEPQKISDAASGVAHTQQRCSSTKNCQAHGCPKGARGASGLCIAHGGGRRCQKAGCQKGAEGRTIFCKAHGGGRRCQSLGCTKSAEGRTEYCIAHGGGRRCSYQGCSKAARGKSGLCIRHGGGKRCQMENCTKSAEGYSGLCIAHGGGRRCQFPDCKKGAQGSTNFCKAHGGGKRCTYEGCTKGAEGSTPFCKAHGGGKRCAHQAGCTKSVHGGTQFCVAHGGGKRCAVPECTKSARGRTNFCVRHGGGKRCKADNCGKSAQGSTDFCKAHGGGRRCFWGQPGSNIGNGSLPCDRFARGKRGLCAAHIPFAEDQCVHGEHQLLSVDPDNLALRKHEKMKEIVDLELENRTKTCTTRGGLHQYTHPANTLDAGMASLREGRVHGGNLIAMLGSNANIGDYSANQVNGCPSEPFTIMKTGSEV